MGVRLLKLKKKLYWGALILLALIVATAGIALYKLTRPLDLEFAQEPNSIEAHEAARKLKLFTEAQTANRQGFVRLSEVEINSFIEDRYNKSDHLSTDARVRMVKSGVLLNAGAVTLVTWHQANLFGLELQLVWQRVVIPSQGADRWTFALRSMRVGDLEIPSRYWPHIDAFLGASDSLFEERKAWLRDVPLVTVARNEQSKSPEFRLYTYVPTEKSKQSEIPSEP